MSKNIKLKCGIVSIIGLPNAGKSTLLNNILNEKGIDSEAEKYMNIVKENKDCVDYLTLNYGEEWMSEDSNVGYRGTYSRKARIVGFWLRREPFKGASEGVSS